MGYTHGVSWNDEKIELEIAKVMRALNLDRMPSNDEMILATHNTKLSNAIRRNGGFYNWACKLDLEIKDSETKTGKKYEEGLFNALNLMGYKAQLMSTKHPYDILINNSVKIDVKSSNRYYYEKDKYSYSFNLEKKYPTCDIYVCYCIDDCGEIDKRLIMPSKFLIQTQLCIGASSVYDKYIDKWDYIKKYSDFYEGIV